MGFTPDAVGNVDASATKRSFTSWLSLFASTTDDDGSEPIRHEPIWCQEPKVHVCFRYPTRRTSSAQRSCDPAPGRYEIGRARAWTVVISVAPAASRTR